MLKGVESKKSVREFFLWGFISFGFFIVFTTEFLSFLGLINRFSIFSCWIILFLFCYYKFKNSLGLYFRKNSNKKIIIYDLNFLYQVLICIILIATLVTALIYPPNTPDSLSYHMSRVMHWIQNNNIEYYSTAIPRQLFVSPFSEYVILHLQLLINGDYLANLVQWFSMVGCVIGVSSITREFGGNKKSQLFSALFCATIPMGILQSSSTQTDYVVSLWIVIFVYFVFRYRATKSIKYIFGCSVALGLAILTKQTAYIFAFPFCIWLLFIALRRPNHFLMLFIVPLIILLINFGPYKRNFELYGNPIGIHDFQKEGYINENFDIKVLSSNIVRNISFNLMVPNSRINNITRDFVYKIHDYLEISVSDPNTTFGGEYWTFFSLYESYASNTLHFVLIVFLILIIILNRNLKVPIKIYVANLIFIFLLFSIILKWNPHANRLLLAFFILSAPIISFGFYKIKSIKFYLLISTILFIYSLPYLLMNHTRPLVASLEKSSKLGLVIKRPYFFESNREKLYFTYSSKTYDTYKNISNKIKEINCKIVGIDGSKTSWNAWEYPLWVLTKDQENGQYSKIFYFNVKNYTNKILKNKINEKPCAKFSYIDYPNLILD